MLPFCVTIPAIVPQRSEITEGLMNYPVYKAAEGKWPLSDYPSLSQEYKRSMTQRWTNPLNQRMGDPNSPNYIVVFLDATQANKNCLERNAASIQDVVTWSLIILNPKMEKVWLQNLKPHTYIHIQSKVTGMKAEGWIQVQIHLFLTSTLDWDEWSLSRSGRLYPGNIETSVK